MAAISDKHSMIDSQAANMLSTVKSLRAGTGCTHIINFSAPNLRKHVIVGKLLIFFVVIFSFTVYIFVKSIT